MKNEKNLCGFSYHKNIANFEAFCQDKNFSKNLLFLRSAIGPTKYVRLYVIVVSIYLILDTISPNSFTDFLQYITKKFHPLLYLVLGSIP